MFPCFNVAVACLGRITALGLAILLALPASAALADTLDEVRERGAVICGVSEGQVGFSAPDSTGTWQGFDVEFCKALAAAIFADTSKVQYRPLSAGERYRVLKAGEIDVLARGDSWTLSMEADDLIRFAGVSYFDAYSLMVRREFGLGSALELSGAVVCTYASAGRRDDLADYFETRNVPVEIKAFDKKEEAIAAYEAKDCEAFAGESSILPTDRSALADPGSHIVLPEVISQEPLGPVVRQRDERWFNLVRWTLNTLIAAEQLGISSETAATAGTAGGTTARRLLGVEAGLGPKLGLDAKWAFNVVSLVGNYGEIFDRTLGIKSPQGLERGLNRLWSQGGLLYSPSFR